MSGVRHAVLVLGLILPLTVRAQEIVSVAPAVENGHESASTAVVATAAAKEPLSLTHRWLDLQTFSHTQRFRNAYESTGWHLFEDGQQRSLLVGAVKIDAQAKYTIHFRASSGTYFNWAFADYAGDGITTRGKEAAAFARYTPAQITKVFAAVAADPGDFNAFLASHSTGWDFYMRELYGSATPLGPVTVEFGSLGIERGLSTEITTFDEDGYVSGERVRVHDAKHLYFDEIGFTNAFFGDLYTPNLFVRGTSLTKFNYHQLFLRKRVNDRVAFSGEHTWQNGSRTLREAVTVGVPEVKAIDSIRFEGYQRLNSTSFQGISTPSATGLALAVEKRYRNAKGDAGFASIDTDYAGTYGADRLANATAFALNGDAYGVGKRVFVHSYYRMGPVITAFGYYTHEVGAKVLNLNEQGFNAGLSFDLKALANTEKKIF